MATKQPPLALANSISTSLRSTINLTQPETTDKVIDRKRTMLGIVDSALKQFSNNLAEGKVQINTTSDLDRIVKLSLLLSGEADAIVGQPSNVVEGEIALNLAREKAVSETLTLEDTSVKDVYNKLLETYNQVNNQ